MPSVSGHARFIWSGEEGDPRKLPPILHNSLPHTESPGVGIIMHDLVGKLVPFAGLNVHETSWESCSQGVVTVPFPSTKASPMSQLLAFSAERAASTLKLPPWLLALPACLLWRPHKLRPHCVGQTPAFLVAIRGGVNTKCTVALTDGTVSCSSRARFPDSEVNKQSKRNAG